VVKPWLDMSTNSRVDLVASYFHFAGTSYASTPGGIVTAVQPGDLFEGIESITIVPEGRGVDPLWIVKATRRRGTGSCE